MSRHIFGISIGKLTLETCCWCYCSSLSSFLLYLLVRCINLRKPTGKTENRLDSLTTRRLHKLIFIQLWWLSPLLLTASSSSSLPSYTLRNLQHHRIHLNGSISEGNYHNGSHFGATKIHSHSLLLQVPRICEIDLNTNNGGCGWQAMNGVAPR